MSSPALPEGLAAYLAARDQEHRDRLAQQWASLSDREQRLVREAAVMGYVRGTLGGPHRDQIPPDTAIVAEVLSAADSMGDLYPTLHLAGRGA